MRCIVRHSASLAMVAIVLAAPPSLAARNRTALFSIAIGYNRSHDPNLANLKYADDDAVRNDQLMRDLGSRSVLLAELDPASKQLYSKRGVPLTPPTLATLSAAIDQLNRHIDQARGRSERSVLYLFYTGHGNVQRGEGYVQLRDGRLTRSKLRELLRRCRADLIQVVIDACKSYYMVFERGPGGKRRPAAGPFLPSTTTLGRNTGFLLSTSSATESHEWEAFQGGIFSHEVRSAMRGAADLNRDRLVTFEEIAAFIYTANKTVPNAKYRPRFFAFPPKKDGKTRRGVFVDLRGARGRRLLFDSAGARRHYFIEDATGVRLADLHPGKKQSVSVLLPMRGMIYVRETRSHKEYLLPEAAAPPLLLSRLEKRASTSRPRGAEHDSFRKLFDQPFDQPALRAYRKRPPDDLIDPLPPSSVAYWLRPAIGIAAVAVLATGGLLTGLAARQRGSVDDKTSNAERQDVNTTIDGLNRGAVSCYAVGGALAAGYLIWRLWPRPRVRITVSAASSGGQLGVSGRW